MLKVIAKELKVPVLALAQLNRNLESDTRQKGSAAARPQLSDLRDSGSIEQDADMVCFISRPNMNKDKNEISEEEWRAATLIIAKHRNGPLADIKLSFEGEYTRFLNVEEE
jgi:replicative DNA helicase